MPINIAQTLSPRRGKPSSMATSDKKITVLAAGELFIEYPEDGLGNSGDYGIKIGDGSTQYENLPYAFTSDTIVSFTADSSTTVDAALDKIISGAKISTIVSAVKRAIELSSSYPASLIANTAITAKTLIGEVSNGKYASLTANSTIDITYPILYSKSAVAADGTISNSKLIGNEDVSGTTTFSTAGLVLYAKGMINGTLFTINSFTTTKPSTEDGYEYLSLGITSGTNTLTLVPNHDVYKYSNGVFGRYSDNGDYGSEDQDPLSN